MQFVEYKRPHIINIRSFMIGKFRQLSRCPKPILESASVYTSMYTTKQKIKVHVIFFLTFIPIAIFTSLILRERLKELYERVDTLPLAMPPQWMIPVWAVLYILIAISGAQIWTRPPSQIRSFALWAWTIQIILNLIWPICFFYVPIAVLTPILITIVFIILLVLMLCSFLISRLSTYLLLPYFLMIIYQLLLHWIFFILNISFL